MSPMRVIVSAYALFPAPNNAEGIVNAAYSFLPPHRQVPDEWPVIRI